MKKTPSSFLEKFRRITSAESYMPEIDGLRFIAIFWVVAMMHITNFVNMKFYDGKLFSGYFSSFILEGVHGVTFFFMISGFILGLPFAKQRMQGGKKVSLKNYYLRRLTRLEPPYLAALLIAFIGLVLLNNYSFTALLPHLGASAIYAHGFIYGAKSTVLGVAWSLELEVQFYIAAPFLGLIYSIRGTVLRRLLFIGLISFYISYAYMHYGEGVPLIITAPHSFLIGMFLCDLYINKVKLPGNENGWFVSGIVIFLLLPFFLSLHSYPVFFVKHLLLGLLLYIGLTNASMKKVLSIQWISIIGGMCYSIYLIQFVIMSGVSRFLGKPTAINPWAGFLLYYTVLLILVLGISMIFYRLIEQPCMRKDWYKKRTNYIT